MAAPKVQKIQKSSNNICDKCGSIMKRRVIAVKESKTFNFERILQCTVCRHWTRLN